jgi:cytochrome c-type biogenesis protein CcmH
MKSLLAQAAVLLALAVPALAVQPDEILKDPALEARARALSTELRCLVCQNQSIDESDAPLARDLRILLREQLQQGKSDAQVMDFIVARYGDYVRLRPPFNSSTIILWGFPFVLLAAAGIYLYSRKPNVSATTEAALSADEEKRLKRLLSGANSTEKP